MNINDILEQHKAWLNGFEDCKRANLRGADLHDVDFYCVDLRYADLHGADLHGADLRCANLLGANLLGADLHGANLRDADLRRAYLHDADFRGANLRDADLRRADLRGANLCGANLDLSAFPLWCGGLDVHIDDQIATQLLYHLLRNVLYSKNVSVHFKELLSNSDIVEQANQFHRVYECGVILVEEKEE